jgi:hypothetical protein
VKAKPFIVAVILVVIFCGAARAQEGVGIGVILGEPTGVSLKAWINEKQAVDAAAAWSYSENDSFQFHADYLLHDSSLIQDKDFHGKFPVYVGVGGRIKLKDENGGHGRNHHDDLLGVRVPFGISYLFADAPVDLFFEVVPVLDIAPDTHLDLNAAVGARFYIGG